MATYETMGAPGVARRAKATRRLQVAHALAEALAAPGQGPLPHPIAGPGVPGHTGPPGQPQQPPPRHHPVPGQSQQPPRMVGGLKSGEMLSEADLLKANRYPGPRHHPVPAAHPHVQGAQPRPGEMLSEADLLKGPRQIDHGVGPIFQPETRPTKGRHRPPTGLHVGPGDNRNAVGRHTFPGHQIQLGGHSSRSDLMAEREAELRALIRKLRLRALEGQAHRRHRRSRGSGGGGPAGGGGG
jgi:hypothetical protein